MSGNPTASNTFRDIICSEGKRLARLGHSEQELPLGRLGSLSGGRRTASPVKLSRSPFVRLYQLSDSTPPRRASPSKSTARNRARPHSRKVREKFTRRSRVDSSTRHSSDKAVEPERTSKSIPTASALKQNIPSNDASRVLDNNDATKHQLPSGASRDSEADATLTLPRKSGNSSEVEGDVSTRGLETDDSRSTHSSAEQDVVQIVPRMPSAENSPVKAKQRRKKNKKASNVSMLATLRGQLLSSGTVSEEGAVSQSVWESDKKPAVDSFKRKRNLSKSVGGTSSGFGGKEERVSRKEESETGVQESPRKKTEHHKSKTSFGVHSRQGAGEERVGVGKESKDKVSRTPRKGKVPDIEVCPEGKSVARKGTKKKNTQKIDKNTAGKSSQREAPTKSSGGAEEVGVEAERLLGTVTRSGRKVKISAAAQLALEALEADGGTDDQVGFLVYAPPNNSPASLSWSKELNNPEAIVKEVKPETSTTPKTGTKSPKHKARESPAGNRKSRVVRHGTPVPAQLVADAGSEVRKKKASLSPGKRKMRTSGAEILHPSPSEPSSQKRESSRSPSKTKREILQPSPSETSSPKKESSRSPSKTKRSLCEGKKQQENVTTPPLNTEANTLASPSQFKSGDAHPPVQRKKNRILLAKKKGESSGRVRRGVGRRQGRHPIRRLSRASVPAFVRKGRKGHPPQHLVVRSNASGSSQSLAQDKRTHSKPVRESAGVSRQVKVTRSTTPRSKKEHGPFEWSEFSSSQVETVVVPEATKIVTKDGESPSASVESSATPSPARRTRSSTTTPNHTPSTPDSSTSAQQVTSKKKCRTTTSRRDTSPSPRSCRKLVLDEHVSADRNEKRSPDTSLEKKKEHLAIKSATLKTIDKTEDSAEDAPEMRVTRGQSRVLASLISQVESRLKTSAPLPENLLLTDSRLGSGRAQEEAEDTTVLEGMFSGGSSSEESGSTDGSDPDEDEDEPDEDEGSLNLILSESEVEPFPEKLPTLSSTSQSSGIRLASITPSIDESKSSIPFSTYMDPDSATGVSVREIKTELEESTESPLNSLPALRKFDSGFSEDDAMIKSPVKVETSLGPLESPGDGDNTASAFVSDKLDEYLVQHSELRRAMRDDPGVFRPVSPPSKFRAAGPRGADVSRSPDRHVHSSCSLGTSVKSRVVVLADHGRFLFEARVVSPQVVHRDAGCARRGFRGGHDGRVVRVCAGVACARAVGTRHRA